jgi:type I restriction enzyme R subunit
LALLACSVDRHKWPVSAGYRLLHGFTIANFTDHDHVRRFAHGISQCILVAQRIDTDFALVTFHDKTATTGELEREIEMDAFPSPAELWTKYLAWKGLDFAASTLVEQNYHAATNGRAPRYYQATAVNRAVAAVASGQNRILLVMATGTGKTYTAFQIIWRLWKARAKKRILFLADRNILVDQTKGNDFTPFGGAMTKVANRHVDKSYEIYLALYQAVSGTSDEQNIYKQFSPDSIPVGCTRAEGGPSH